MRQPLHPLHVLLRILTRFVQNLCKVLWVDVFCVPHFYIQDTTSLDKTAVTHTVPVDRLRPYFRYNHHVSSQQIYHEPPLNTSFLPPLSLLTHRELDLGVFATLRYSPVSRTLVDSEEHTKEREELMLQPPQLLFLLQDLNTKISSTLSAFGSKRLGTKVNHGTIMWSHVTITCSPP